MILSQCSYMLSGYTVVPAGSWAAGSGPWRQTGPGEPPKILSGRRVGGILPLNMKIELRSEKVTAEGSSFWSINKQSGISSLKTLNWQTELIFHFKNTLWTTLLRIAIVWTTDWPLYRDNLWVECLIGQIFKLLWIKLISRSSSKFLQFKEAQLNSSSESTREKS